MGLFDGTVKKFAMKLCDRLEAYANALDEQAPRNVPGNHNYAAALTLRIVSKAIKDVAESE